MRQESEILFKCRGQYIGGGKLLNRRNTLDINRSDTHCYLFIFHIESCVPSIAEMDVYGW